MDVLEASTLTSLTFFSIIFDDIIALCVSVKTIMMIIAIIHKAAISNDMPIIPELFNN